MTAFLAGDVYHVSALGMSALGMSSLGMSGQGMSGQGMSAVAGPYLVAVAVLGVAGMAKVARPGPTATTLAALGLPLIPTNPARRARAARALGVGEIALAAVAAVTGAPVAAAGVALAYALFAAISVRLLARDGGAGCGCFGVEEAPLSWVHVGLDAAACVVAFAVLFTAPGESVGILDVTTRQPWAGVPFLGLIAIATVVARLAFTWAGAARSGTLISGRPVSVGDVAEAARSGQRR